MSPKLLLTVRIIRMRVGLSKRLNSMYTFSKWTLDGNISKAFKLTESKSIQIRVDAINILNHPWPADPIGLGFAGTNFSSDNFGQITSKGGNVNNLPQIGRAHV